MSSDVCILLVDDDEIDRENVHREFARCNFHTKIHTAVDGIDALEKLTGTGGQEKLDPMPAIILLDINMPRMNGIEFLQELRADPDFRETMVIVLTSSDSASDIKATYQFNISGYLLKPLKVAEFLQAIGETDLQFQLINKSDKQ